MKAADPIRLTLAVATYRRPEGLSRLLAGLAALDPAPGWHLSVVVVDNSPEAAAMPTIRDRRDGFPHPLAALHEPRKGLSKARNAALCRALADRADYLGFIDDDEVPHPGWLRAHVRALAVTGAEASLGAVHAEYLEPPPRWIAAGRFLELRGHAQHGAMPFGATSNIVFALAPVRRARLAFDPVYDQAGGEDTAFFAAYAETGARIVFAADAFVTESVPRGRATLRWLWRRWRRTGQTSGRILLRRRGGRAACRAGGLLRLGLGASVALTGLPLAPLGAPALWARGVRVAARGIGFLDAASGRFTLEYEAPER